MKQTFLSDTIDVIAVVFFFLLTGLLVPCASAADEQPDKANAPFHEWKHSGSIFILTTPKGANLPASVTVKDFPLLVRLHKDFFDFSQAKTNGEDIRFSSEAGQPLAHQIEEWNAKQGSASIWVRLPIIKGNARQAITLHWGNDKAEPASDGKAVCSAANDYASVWHMHDTVQDEVGTLKSIDTGTTPTPGMIGTARHFPGGKGIFGGDNIPDYPSAAKPHTTEAWFLAKRSNTTIIAWGNEPGGRGTKVRMQLRNPPHLHIDSNFSDVKANSTLPMGEWLHVAHTYDGTTGRLYINGQLDGEATPELKINSPARLWIGGWYNNYDFIGDIDEVRISRVARSAHWLKLQYENQKPQQTLVGHIVQPGNELALSASKATIAEGQSATFTATAGDAQKIYWIIKSDVRETIIATDRLRFTFDAGRVNGDQKVTLVLKTIHPTHVKTSDIDITIQEAIPDPRFTLKAPKTWDGRQTIEIVPQFEDGSSSNAQGAKPLNYTWNIEGVAVIKEIAPGKLILRRAQGNGSMKISAAIDNGGAPGFASVTIDVKQPAKVAWIPRQVIKDEWPQNNQFYSRNDKNEGTLNCIGKLQQPAEMVFLKLYADDKLTDTQTAKVAADLSYTLSASLKPGLIKYRIEFGTKTGDKETLLHTATNLVCGDAYIIQGQSNAVATDFGKDDPDNASDWIRSFGSTTGDPRNSRTTLWGNAVARSRGGDRLQIGYWGMDLAHRLVEQQKMPICIINGAVGGTRIDQHQRNDSDPTDATTIYGRLLWRIEQAGLTHSIRAVLWHQGENDQGADGPDGGYGYERYQQYFVDLAADWKTDYPNIEHYYVFQIWPKSCSMGIKGSDNKLREVQRSLPALFSNLTVMSTLGIKPVGTCHYPAQGYAVFAKLISPLIERDIYGVAPAKSITAPDLKRASFAGDSKDELLLEFDQPIIWLDTLLSQFHLDDQAGQFDSGSAKGSVITLRLKAGATGKRVTYLDSANWNPDNLLLGDNGIAALTFCDVPIQASR